jgi:hypothetical protein
MYTISDENTTDIATKLINDSNFSSWVFSYGGCGTNFLRKVFSIYKLTGVKNKGIIDIIKSIHVFHPPTDIQQKNFVGIYVFGNPILSVASICRRNISKTINILAGKKIFSNNPSVDIEQLLSGDVLRLEKHFDNWVNANVNYPIIFIKYEDLTQETIHNICQELKTKYNIKFNEKIISKFRERKCSYDTINPDHLEELKKIYNHFQNRIEHLPSYWIKEPT